MENYDIAIVGAGPAGLSAALYAARYKMKTVVYGEITGGTITTAHKVENWPSIDSITGFELGERMANQVRNIGVPIISDRIQTITKNEEGFIVKGYENEVQAKKVIVAIGTKRRELGLPREKELTGKGVSYCATCDGLFFKNKTIAIVGGSDAALSEAIYLADIAAKVYIIYRKGSFMKAEPIWVDMAKNNTKIEPVFNSNVTELLGEKKLTGVKLDTGKELTLDGLFIAIGSDPDKSFFDKCGVMTTENGYVIVDKHMKTNVKGIFSAGEANDDTFGQAIVASAEGAIAAHTAFEEMKKDSQK